MIRVQYKDYENRKRSAIMVGRFQYLWKIYKRNNLSFYNKLTHLVYVGNVSVDIKVCQT